MSSLSKYVVVDESVDNTSRENDRGSGIGSWCGACWTVICRRFCKDMPENFAVFTHARGTWYVNCNRRVWIDSCSLNVPRMLWCCCGARIGDLVLTGGNVQYPFKVVQYVYKWRLWVVLIRISVEFTRCNKVWVLWSKVVEDRGYAMYWVFP